MLNLKFSNEFLRCCPAPWVEQAQRQTSEMAGTGRALVVGLYTLKGKEKNQWRLQLKAGFELHSIACY